VTQLSTQVVVQPAAGIASTSATGDVTHNDHSASNTITIAIIPVTIFC
jgi:hypothetical protein